MSRALAVAAVVSFGCGTPDPWSPEEPPPLGSSVGGSAGAGGGVATGGSSGVGGSSGAAGSGGSVQCSPDDTTSAYLHVTNTTVEPVRVVELAKDCHEVEEDVIPAYGASGFYSYVTHVFRFYWATSGTLIREITIQHDGTTEETVP